MFFVFVVVSFLINLIMRCFPTGPESVKKKNKNEETAGPF